MSWPTSTAGSLLMRPRGSSHRVTQVISVTRVQLDGTPVLVASNRPFPAAAGAGPMTNQVNPWVASRGPLALVCFDYPHTSADADPRAGGISPLSDQQTSDGARPAERWRPTPDGQPPAPDQRLVELSHLENRKRTPP